MNPRDAHLAARDHRENGGRFNDDRVATAVIRALNRPAELLPDQRKRAEDKLFEILGAEPIEGVTIERE